MSDLLFWWPVTVIVLFVFIFMLLQRWLNKLADRLTENMQTAKLYNKLCDDINTNIL